MSGLRGLLVVFCALVLQAALGRLAPGIHGWVDVMLVPVALYGIASTQRAAMVSGAVTGLLSDSWFYGGPFGLHGFKWTFLGWAVGALATRFDLNQPGGRLVTGAAVSLGDDLLDLAVRGMLDAAPQGLSPAAVLVKAAVTALLVGMVGGMLERERDGQRLRPARVP
jgi:cell shape-determining protein MreD